MQCPACRADYESGSDACPVCNPSADQPSERLSSNSSSYRDTPGAESASVTPSKRKSSTLIDFPGVTRPQVPAWRQELSKRVQEIQARREREAHETALLDPGIGRTRMELEDANDPRDQNPIVAKALRRLERARQPVSVPQMVVSRSGAAAAVARAPIHQPCETSPEPVTPGIAPFLDAQAGPATVRRILPVAKPEDAPSPFSDGERAWPKTTVAETKTAAATVPQSLPLESPKVRAVEPLGRAAEDLVAPALVPAQLAARVASGALDLFVIAFAASPFGAVIELTNGDWDDPRVVASMAGIVILVAFLYLAASIALCGKTWGMSLTSTVVVDRATLGPPDTGQSVKRALLYMMSLAAFGAGLIYAVFDRDGRTAHDILSETLVMRE